MDAIIARLNVAFYRKRLGEETDEAKRAMIERLLAEELDKLARLPEPQKKNESCGIADAGLERAQSAPMRGRID